MTAQNKITLTIAGDSTGVEKALRRTEAAAAHAGQVVEKSSGGMGESLEKAGKSARNTTEVFRGLGDATTLMGGEMGAGANQAIMMTQAVHGLGQGVGGLITKFGGAKVAAGGLAIGILTLGAGIAAHIDHTSMLNEANRTLADTTYYATDALAFLGQGVPGLGSALGWLKGKADGWSQSAHAATAATDELTAAMQRAHEASLFQAPDTNPGGDGFVTSADLQNIAIQSYADQSGATMQTYLDGLSKSSGSGGAKAARSVSAALDKVAQAAKEKLSKLQGIADKFSQVGKTIFDSFAPKLEAGDRGLLLFPGASLLDKLKKQLTDTLHLKQDLARLAKAGLSGDLLTQLVQGGLGSIGAADELLAGGKSGIHAVNATASAINAAGGSIAGAEVARQVKNQPQTVKVEFDVKGAQKEFEVWLAKLFATKGPKQFGLKAA